MDNWAEEFEIFLAPHADQFLATVKREQELNAINLSYNKEYSAVTNTKCRRVTFDTLTVEFHYKC